MKVQSLFLAALFCASSTGCGYRSLDTERPTDKSLLGAVDSHKAIPAGSSAIIAYARDPDGVPLTGCESSYCTKEHGILMIINSMPTSSPEVHAVKVGENGRFTYFYAIDGAISPYGLIKFAPKGNNPIWIQRNFGDGPPIDSMDADFNLPSGKSVRYVYKASTESDHVRIFNAVKTYLINSGIN